MPDDQQDLIDKAVASIETDDTVLDDTTVVIGRVMIMDGVKRGEGYDERLRTAKLFVARTMLAVGWKP